MSARATRTTAVTTSDIPAAAATNHRTLRRATASVGEALAAAVIASGVDTPAPQATAIIPVVTSAGEHTVPVLGKDGSPVVSRDHTSLKSITSREYPHLTHEQATTILRQHDKASFTIASACASIIADFLISSQHSALAAKDAKAWKTLKKACEIGFDTITIGGEDSEIPWGFTFPQQWENYWSAAKAYLANGGEAMALLYRNSDDADCVRTMQWLKAEAKRLDTSVPSTKSERAASSLSSVVESMLGGAEGKGEVIAAGDVSVDPSTAKMLLDIAEANLGTTACRARLQSEDCEQTLRRLIATYGGPVIFDMVQDLTH